MPMEPDDHDYVSGVRGGTLNFSATMGYAASKKILSRFAKGREDRASAASQRPHTSSTRAKSGLECGTGLPVIVESDKFRQGRNGYGSGYQRGSEVWVKGS